MVALHDFRGGRQTRARQSQADLHARPGPRGGRLGEPAEDRGGLRHEPNRPRPGPDARALPRHDGLDEGEPESGPGDKEQAGHRRGEYLQKRSKASGVAAAGPQAPPGTVSASLRPRPSTGGRPRAARLPSPGSNISRVCSPHSAIPLSVITSQARRETSWRATTSQSRPLRESTRRLAPSAPQYLMFQLANRIRSPKIRHYTFPPTKVSTVVRSSLFQVAPPILALVSPR